MSAPGNAGPSYPASQKYLGNVAEGYLARRQDHPTWAWENAQVEQYVRLREGTRVVLDVPFGTGRYVPFYLGAGWRVHGCDISPDMIAEAERTLGAEAFARCDVKVAPAESIPLPDASIDVIVSSRFIQWLPDLANVDKVIAEFSRVGRRELFLQLRIPAEPRGAGKEAPKTSFVRRILRSVRRRLGAQPPAPRARIVSHPEPELLAILERHRWKLDEIGVECPTSRGLRFYRFSKS
jgi:ubiquinone/menaquinone biosynthesis C-methylase UbiE